MFSSFFLEFSWFSFTKTSKFLPISCFFAQKDCFFFIFSSVFEAFSAPSLRQRYLQLHPEADGAAGAAGAVAPPSVTATELTEADHEESNDAADAADADVADWKHAQNEETKPKTKNWNELNRKRKKTYKKTLQQREADMVQTFRVARITEF